MLSLASRRIGRAGLNALFTRGYTHLNRSSGVNEPPWLQNQNVPQFEPLLKSLDADVCIVGAGISGLSTAYTLGRAGKRVVVLDDGEIASGETGRTTAHLMSAFDDRYYECERLFGLQKTKLLAQSHCAAIDLIENICKQERIDADFMRLPGYLIPQTPRNAGELEKELNACHRVGLNVQMAEAPIPTRQRALMFPNQGQLHPIKYMSGLAQVITQKYGVRIFTNTHASKIEGVQSKGYMNWEGIQQQRDAAASGVVETEHGSAVHCKNIVVATNSPVNDRVVIHTKVTPYRSYVVALTIPYSAVGNPHLLWTTGFPYTYVRTQPFDDKNALLIVGGEDHETGRTDEKPEERWGRLEQFAREHYPQCGEVKFHWSGQVVEPVDHLAYIGRNPIDDDNVYIVTGDSGNGMTHGTIAGMLLHDLILGRQNPWADLYDPRRKPIHNLMEFAQDAVKMQAQFKHWLTPGDVEQIEQIPAGEGAVIRTGLAKHAVFKDTNGEVVHMSAVCPHLKCVVHWNKAEKTWDCPCHGSRFDALGKVINGPANSDLELLGVDHPSIHGSEQGVDASKSGTQQRTAATGSEEYGVNDTRNPISQMDAESGRADTEEMRAHHDDMHNMPVEDLRRSSQSESQQQMMQSSSRAQQAKGVTVDPDLYLDHFGSHLQDIQQQPHPRRHRQKDPSSAAAEASKHVSAFKDWSDNGMGAENVALGQQQSRREPRSKDATAAATEASKHVAAFKDWSDDSLDQSLPEQQQTQSRQQRSRRSDDQRHNPSAAAAEASKHVDAFKDWSDNMEVGQRPRRDAGRDETSFRRDERGYRAGTSSEPIELNVNHRHKPEPISPLRTGHSDGYTAASLDMDTKPTPVGPLMVDMDGDRDLAESAGERAERPVGSNEDIAAMGLNEETSTIERDDFDREEQNAKGKQHVDGEKFSTPSSKVDNYVGS